MPAGSTSTVLVLVGIAAVLSPLIHQRVRLAELGREIETLKPRAQAVLEDRERQRRETDRHAAVLSLVATRKPLVVILDQLSSAVPDGSWLLSLSLNGRALVMDGLSPSAAATALALEQSRAVSGIVFRSAITRDPTTDLEHFQLSAAIGGAKP